jgi:hypothetical protein
VLEFPVDELGLHPVAKPVALLEFRIETYTRRGAVVLDTAMDTGSDSDRRRKTPGVGSTTGFYLMPDPQDRCRSTTVCGQLDVFQTDYTPMTGYQY